MFLKLLEEHPGKILGIAIGFLFGLIFLFVGFWKTIIFVLFIAIGFFIGKKYDSKEDIKEILEKILPDKFFNK